MLAVRRTLEKPASAHTAYCLEKIARPIVTLRTRDRQIVDRRTVLAGAGGAALATLGVGSGRAEGEAPKAAAPADPVPLTPTSQFQDAFAKIVGNGTPIEGRVTLEMPEDAENGNIVPYTIAIESPMTEADSISRVYLLSTQNPQASVATFHFTPLSGKAQVSGRMRLAKTQEVVAVALTNANSLLIARTTVNVGIGGCGVE
jgi:sulfur-oxidizing protein SoxY